MIEPLLLPACNPAGLTGSGNHTYLLGRRAPVLIDAGVGHPQHLERLREAIGDRGSMLTAVLVTHGHPDHASGAPALRRTWPQARFCKYPWPGTDETLDVPWTPLAHGTPLTADEDVLETIHTPGHSPDHVCFWDPGSRTLFSGDLAVLGSTVMIPAARGGNMREYLASLRRIIELEPARMLPAHGAAIDRPLALLREYLAHRERREQQILSALGKGVETVMELAERIYGTLPSPVAEAARETVLAHLEKLAAEDAVVAEDGQWRLA